MLVYFRSLVVLGLCVGSLASCSEGSTGGDPSSGGRSSTSAQEVNSDGDCEPGETRSCVGPGACDGGQQCASDGTGWSACDCGLTGSGGTQGESGSGSATVDSRDLPERDERCDTSGDCVCLKAVLLGTLDSSATGTGVELFVEWLGEGLGADASVDWAQTKPTLDGEYLNQYDIVVVANLAGWSFSEDEKLAVANWSAAGGGIINLSGFSSAASEPDESSQLIGFSGMRFVDTKTADGRGEGPVYYPEKETVDRRSCLASMDDDAMYGTSPVEFSPAEGSMALLTRGLHQVGAYDGWKVVADAPAVVLANDSVSGAPMAVAHEVDGKGRVLAFGDEWVIYTNQWRALGGPQNAVQDKYNVCWASDEDPGFFYSAENIYQARQFWANAFQYVAPPTSCEFKVPVPRD